MSWNTVYSRENNVAYLQLVDGSVVSIPTNQQFKDTSSAGKAIKSVASPPGDNAKLAVIEDKTLLAFYADPDSQSTSSNKDLTCAGDFTVAKYNDDDNKWDTVATSSQSIYKSNATVWSYPGSDTVYLYGGQDCEGQFSGKMFAYNHTLNDFVNVTTETPPTPLEAASASAISNNSVVLIGGKADEGWIAMNQVAVWEAGTWTYRTATNSSNIDSRTEPLVVPVYGDQSEPATSLLVLGGYVAGRDADPFLIQLMLTEDDSWGWTIPQAENLTSDKVLGALTMSKVLVTIGKQAADSAQSKRWWWKRDSSPQYNIAFYDTESWATVDSVSPSSTSSSSSSSSSSTASPTSSNSGSSDKGGSSKLSTGQIAALSTVLPLGVGCLAAAGVYFAIRRRRRNSMPMSPSANRLGDDFPVSKTDAASIDSWHEKHDWFLGRSQNRQSDATLSPPKMNHSNNRFSFPDSVASAASTITRRKVSQPMANRRSDLLDDDEYVSDPENDDFFNQRDVQVLVSSQRRKKLVVTNPDESSDDEAETTNHVL